MKKIIAVFLVLALFPLVSSASLGYSGDMSLVMKGQVGERVCVPWNFWISYPEVDIESKWQKKTVTEWKVSNMVQTAKQRGLVFEHPITLSFGETPQLSQNEVCFTSKNAGTYQGILILKEPVPQTPAEGLSQVITFGVWVKAVIEPKPEKRTAVYKVTTR